MKLNRSCTLTIELAIAVCLMSGAAYAHNHEDSNVILKESRTLQPLNSREETNTHRGDSACREVTPSSDAKNRNASLVEASSPDARAMNTRLKSLVALLRTLTLDEMEEEGSHCDACGGSHIKHYPCGSGSDCISHSGEDCVTDIITGFAGGRVSTSGNLY